MTGEPVKLTAALTRDAYQALNRAAEITGHSRTDTINRALIIYEAISAATLQEHPAELVAEDVDGTALRLAVLARLESTGHPDGLPRT